MPAERWPRWVLNFQGRHGSTALTVSAGALAGTAADGSTFAASLPFDGQYADLPDVDAFATAASAAVPADWGVLLVRKGGFAVARLSGTAVVDSKVGQRHVQGRTKAGGQSQQRFARRRDNQARSAYEAAAGHAARVLAGLAGPLVTGGDRAAVEEALADPALARLRVVGPWLAVPDPRRAVLDGAVLDACAIQVRVHNAP
ncbi:acVLRF1 family peptidyl-tRNA hydrolase [Nocardioides abyssi]|uniref:AcVLRF1 family peptidyl-tRNA hydrolase n=1 Tax=Nocardioides abyssi TaxID=3058370 RepID=A0ABT8EVY3_9ACTN|nr:acVLRF1 family peptidyl-tRNA hydrolase [Nocardioides abyssi]MDN4162131.1 acVLRF1 family peptidyl-tRNA hydrolase [Nocardioides abyssi]